MYERYTEDEYNAVGAKIHLPYAEGTWEIWAFSTNKKSALIFRRHPQGGISETMYIPATEAIEIAKGKR